MSDHDRPDSDGLQRDFLERYLPRQFACDGVHVNEIIKFPRGSSRETWFVDCTLVKGSAREPQALVIRRDFPGGSVCPMPLRTEFEIYHRLQNSNVPVARTLWFEDDPQLLEGNREFYLREQVQGSWEIPHILDPDPQFADLRIAYAKEHIRNLALVHTCDWAGLGFGAIMDVPESAEACARSIIDSFERELSAFQIEPFPILAEAREWLLDHAPASAPRIALLKGTNGYGEEIFRDGKLVAMSDWELARIGDPAYDWAQMQDFAADIVVDGSKVWGLEQALAFYEAQCGIHIELAAVDYYRRLYSLIGMTFCHNAAIPVTRGTDLMARLCWPATEVLYRMKRTMAQTIGIAEPAAAPGG